MQCGSHLRRILGGVDGCNLKTTVFSHKVVALRFEPTHLCLAAWDSTMALESAPLFAYILYQGRSKNVLLNTTNLFILPLSLYHENSMMELTKINHTSMCWHTIQRNKKQRIECMNRDRWLYIIYC